jgi:LPXTG-site transpeptidase (sortase) family protein
MLTVGAQGTVERMSTAAGTLPASRRFDWRTPVRWFGLLCLMGAAFLGGYVLWLLYGTGLETQRAQNDLRPAIERQIEHPKPVSEAPGPGHRVIPGSAYAIIQIPSIDLDMVVVQGTDYASLKKGPGHYLDTADPWDNTGRVGIAGHRTTYLHPFFDLDKTQPGDTIRLLTPYGRFTYAVTRVFVISEEGSGVVLDQTENPTLVLTTCNPKYASSQRLIVEADRLGMSAG